MIAKGKIKDISYRIGGGYTVSLELTDCKLQDLKKVEPEDLKVELKKYREARSNEANAYFHVLVGKIADVLGVSRQRIKNEMIGKYGQPEIIDGKNTYITTQITPEQMQEQEYMHVTLVSVNQKQGRTFYSYMIMRGSHTYDTKEMATLIDGTVEEAKELDIETLPPDELERLKSAWKPKGGIN